jgi:hypothetical protein
MIARAVISEQESLLSQQRQRMEIRATQYRLFWGNVQNALLLLLSATGLVALAALCFALGTWAGVNLPRGIVCSSPHSPCSLLRVREGIRYLD